MKTIPSLLSGLMCLAAAAWPAIASAQSALSGDVGLASYSTPALTRSNSRSSITLPYLYADAGPWYARVDTFGLKTVAWEQGFLELAARVSLEGYASPLPGIGTRAAPVPLGLGTLQETRYGDFFVYGFTDARSGGSLLDFNYAAEFSLGRLTFYPQFGVERRSARYVQHLYGVSTTDASASGLQTYTPGASVNPNAALAIQYPLGPQLDLTLQVRKRWLDKSITDSPLVERSQQTSTLLALTHHFE